jgi:hypothetical protein
MADCPKKQPEPPVCTLRKSDGPRAHCGLSAPHRQSDKQDPTKTYRPNGSKRNDSRTHEEHDEHQVGWLLADCPRPPGLSTCNIYIFRTKVAFLLPINSQASWVTKCVEILQKYKVDIGPWRFRLLLDISPNCRCLLFQQKQNYTRRRKKSKIISRRNLW